MSLTPTMEIASEGVRTPHGVVKVAPVAIGVSVSKLKDGTIAVAARRGDNCVVVALTVDEARHLGAVIAGLCGGSSFNEERRVEASDLEALRGHPSFEFLRRFVGEERTAEFLLIKYEFNKGRYRLVDIRGNGVDLGDGDRSDAGLELSPGGGAKE